MFGLGVNMRSIHERAAVLALVAASTELWHETAELIDQAGSAVDLSRGVWKAFDPELAARAGVLASRVSIDEINRYTTMIEDLDREGVQVITVLDPEYPTNLHAIYNRPPMLFVRGRLTSRDDKAVAVVGTRRPSPEGLLQATRLATELAHAGVTVLSGLAHGIDTAAHRAALGASGRTVAVMGTGIRRTYPAENAELANQIASSGALVSQFWPDAPPRRSSFPMRNVVMSGMAIGTVVVEASSTSGAKMQARLALEHGKRVFLLESLVMHQAWARAYAEHPGTTVVRSVEDILDVLITSTKPVKQLSFG